MSSLLEQAIIDATALKEVAMKTAEKKLVDKYSNKIKEAVDKLLEQDEANFDAADSLEDVNDEDNIPSDLSGQEEVTPKKDPLEKVKSSFMLDGDDDELITIDFSSLKVKPAQQAADIQATAPAIATPAQVSPTPEQAQTTPAVTPAAPMQEGLKQDEEDEADLSEEIEEVDEELDLEKSTEELDEEVEISLDGPSDGVEMPCEGEGCGEMEEEVELDMDESSTWQDDGESYGEKGGTLYEEEEETEAELEEDIELEESLLVDMEGKSDGYRGLTDNERRELQNIELAKRQDEEYQLKMKEFTEALEASENKIKKVQKREKALVKENEELKNTLLSLKEHIEKMNLSNAKLLYMNRTLSSDSLNERQKQQIVETISKVDSVEGAKIAYETLQSSVQSVVRENKAPKSLNEAVSRSSSPFLVRPRNQTANPFAERMKVLAGIKKD